MILDWIAFIVVAGLVIVRATVYALEGAEAYACRAEDRRMFLARIALLCVAFWALVQLAFALLR